MRSQSAINGVGTVQSLSIEHSVVIVRNPDQTMKEQKGIGDTIIREFAALSIYNLYEVPTSKFLFDVDSGIDHPRLRIDQSSTQVRFTRDMFKNSTEKTPNQLVFKGKHLQGWGRLLAVSQLVRNRDIFGTERSPKLCLLERTDSSRIAVQEADQCLFPDERAIASLGEYAMSYFDLCEQDQKEYLQTTDRIITTNPRKFEEIFQISRNTQLLKLIISLHEQYRITIRQINTYSTHFDSQISLFEEIQPPESQVLSQSVKKKSGIKKVVKVGKAKSKLSKLDSSKSQGDKNSVPKANVTKQQLELIIDSEGESQIIENINSAPELETLQMEIDNSYIKCSSKALGQLNELDEYIEPNHIEEYREYLNLLIYSTFCNNLPNISLATHIISPFYQKQYKNIPFIEQKRLHVVIRMEPGRTYFLNEHLKQYKQQAKFAIQQKSVVGIGRLLAISEFIHDYQLFSQLDSQRVRLVEINKVYYAYIHSAERFSAILFDDEAENEGPNQNGGGIQQQGLKYENLKQDDQKEFDETNELLKIKHNHKKIFEWFERMTKQHPRFSKGLEIYVKLIEQINAQPNPSKQINRSKVIRKKKPKVQKGTDDEG